MVREGIKREKVNTPEDDYNAILDLLEEFDKQKGEDEKAAVVKQSLDYFEKIKSRLAKSKILATLYTNNQALDPIREKSIRTLNSVVKNQADRTNIRNMFHMTYNKHK
jgi:tetrahydromethanopterin S-methyltransferase subunit G